MNNEIKKLEQAYETSKEIFEMAKEKLKRGLDAKVITKKDHDNDLRTLNELEEQMDNTHEKTLEMIQKLDG